MITISYEWEGTDLPSLASRLDAAVAEKLTDLTFRLHDKVLANLSGKILNKVSGQLIGSVAVAVDTESEGGMVGTVVIDPETPKAWALEKGGEGSYTITATKASVLKFMGKGGDVVYRKTVPHPASKAFGYLAEAADEMRPIVSEEFRRVIQDVLDGKR